MYTIAINIWYSIIILESFIFFYIICDYVTVTVTCNKYVI